MPRGLVLAALSRREEKEQLGEAVSVLAETHGCSVVEMRVLRTGNRDYPHGALLVEVEAPTEEAISAFGEAVSQSFSFRVTVFFE